jgi:imidazole glycerol-phosphate synthase subunit HisF
MSTRIIAKLDVKPPHVVKPIHFEGLRKIGCPIDLATQYYDQGADELFYIDIVSSLYRREILIEGIQNTASKIFIPFAVGGGVRSIDDVSTLLHSGADKVMINTYAIHENKDIINIAAETFGSQAIVAGIEAKKWDKYWECYTDCGKIQTGVDVVEWAKEVEERGAGEIFLQSVDRDGRKNGFDIQLAKAVVDSVNIPVVVASGANSPQDILKLIKEVGPSGVSIASILHYKNTTIFDIKSFLKQNGIEVSL